MRGRPLAMAAAVVMGVLWIVGCRVDGGRADEDGVGRMLLDGERPPSLRIVGGEKVQESKYPWFVSLQTGNRYHMCGGTLIASEWVLTAAHCVHNSDSLKYLVVNQINLSDQTDAIVRTPIETVVHPDYDSTNFQNDIALIRLSDRVSGIQPLSVADVGSTFGFEDLARVIGFGSLFDLGSNANSAYSCAKCGVPCEKESFCRWGYGSCEGTKCYGKDAKTEELQQVDVNLQKQEYCRKKYWGYGSQHSLCASSDGKDSCSGDSGGPLFVETASAGFIQIGLVSYGHSCAYLDYPGVYTKVSAYTSWIKSRLTASRSFSLVRYDAGLSIISQSDDSNSPTRGATNSTEDSDGVPNSTGAPTPFSSDAPPEDNYNSMNDKPVAIIDGKIAALLAAGIVVSILVVALIFFQPCTRRGSDSSTAAASDAASGGPTLSFANKVDRSGHSKAPEQVGIPEESSPQKLMEVPSTQGAPIRL